jgi:hypothetical protein
MRSHTYEFTARELVRALAPTLAAFLGIAAALHLAAWQHWLPQPPATLHADETALRHQARASVTRHPAEIVVLGDSTCGAGVAAVQLSNELPDHAGVINLALIIGIDLGAYADAAADFAAANPGQVRWVVLLVSPLKLRGGADNQGHIEFWRRLRDEAHGRGSNAPSPWRAGDYFAARAFRDRLASRLLPEPLRGTGAGRFGFTTELDRCLTTHGGGLADVGEFVPRPGQSPADWSVSPKVEAECRAFCERFPRGARLAIGLTPVALAVAPPNARQLHAECLRQLNAWMRADLVLTNLPAVLPTPCFSPSAHLNARGQREFTSALAKELAKRP